MRQYTWILALLALVLAGCSDDAVTPPDGPGKVVDKSIVLTEKGPIVAEATVPGWLDAAPKVDAKNWACTAGAANMCDGYKTQYCNNGVCTACPANALDCDRKGDCECKGGVCSGTSCKMP